MTTKLLIIGHMRHGKDTLAEILNEHFGLKFKSSSEAASEIFIYNELKHKYGYETPYECFEDRVNHRAEWFNMISDYNKDDGAALAKEILKKADCYIGMRNPREIEACIEQELFDLIIWVDASERLPEEPKDSFAITKDIADVIIENNDTLEKFIEKAKRFGKLIIKTK